MSPTVRHQPPVAGTRIADAALLRALSPESLAALDALDRAFEPVVAHDEACDRCAEADDGPCPEAPEPWFPDLEALP